MKIHLIKIMLVSVAMVCPIRSIQCKAYEEYATISDAGFFKFNPRNKTIAVIKDNEVLTHSLLSPDLPIQDRINFEKEKILSFAIDSDGITFAYFNQVEGAERRFKLRIARSDRPGHIFDLEEFSDLFEFYLGRIGDNEGTIWLVGRKGSSSSDHFSALNFLVSNPEWIRFDRTITFDMRYTLSEKKFYILDGDGIEIFDLVNFPHSRYVEFITHCKSGGSENYQSVDAIDSVDSTVVDYSITYNPEKNIVFASGENSDTRKRSIVFSMHPEATCVRKVHDFIDDIASLESRGNVLVVGTKHKSIIFDLSSNNIIQVLDGISPRVAPQAEFIATWQFGTLKIWKRKTLHDYR